MGLEPRGCADQGKPEANPTGEEPLETPKPKVKSFEIDKRLVCQAWEKVRANHGAPGVDAVSISQFGERERDNLYKLWNRMSSGSYFPGPVRAVEIPKDHGKGVRVLGVPNTADRVAQTAAAMLLEAAVEPVFHPDSYGYRPGRDCHQALAVTRSEDGLAGRSLLPPAGGRRAPWVVGQLITKGQDGTLRLDGQAGPSSAQAAGAPPVIAGGRPWPCGHSRTGTRRCARPGRRRP